MLRQLLYIGITLSIAVLIGILCEIEIVENPVFRLRQETVAVKTPRSGDIIGKTVKLDNGNVVHEFYNIPYALPPVGELRFQPARQCGAGRECWQGEFDASQATTVKCIQMLESFAEGQTEDCLKLSVRSTNLTQSKPVVVFIHGGGVMYGHNGQAGYSFDAELTDVLDVVTVNINFRLGYLGFNTWEETWNSTSGTFANNGIRDQVTALSWIKENIVSFGGDPERVTVLGESGGASSILALLSSPLANNLFHNAWSMSPGPELRFDYKKGDVESPGLQSFVPDALGCTQSTLEERRLCLLEVPAAQFTSAGLPQAYSLGKGYFDFPLRYEDTSTEYIGMIYTDPTVIPQPFKDLRNAPHKPATKVKVIISNLAEESSVQSQVAMFQVASSVFPNMTYLTTTLEALYPNITNDPDIVDTTLNVLYPNMEPQLVWDTLTTDLRQTCPISDLAEAMSQSPNHVIHRLYLSASMQNAPISAFHMWDTIALFNFKLIPYPPGERDLKFRDELRSILKDLAYGKVGWGTFPSETKEVGNGSPMSVVTKAKPHERICDVFKSLGLDKYGSQN